MKRRRAEDSADGLVLMTSSVTSSYSADGLREQSQESAGSLLPDARGSDVVEEISSRKLQRNQQMLFGFWKLSNGKKFYIGFIYKGSAIEEVFCCVFVRPVERRRWCNYILWQNSLNIQCTNRGKNEEIDEAIYRH
ncbi:hypothetical protein F511_25726 [Dorcoceras hygrometricum]|uniref:Uncharacterized protein n=1 Tax=Dorcoceras hygrometricum TaxID=472368 RepID=A0A2Z7BU86_9LAMI|nr:hypothetical protein F511_25726 [Dorcoceras hygrometricum]